MSRFVKTTFICASCKAERKDANHWFVVVPQARDKFLYFVAALDPVRPTLEGNELPVCGEQCLQKIESKIIAGVEVV